MYCSHCKFAVESLGAIETHNRRVAENGERAYRNNVDLRAERKVKRTTVRRGSMVGMDADALRENLEQPSEFAGVASFDHTSIAGLRV